MIVKKFAGVKKDAAESRVLIFSGNETFSGLVPVPQSLSDDCIFHKFVGRSAGKNTPVFPRHPKSSPPFFVLGTRISLAGLQSKFLPYTAAAHRKKIIAG